MDAGPVVGHENRVAGIRRIIFHAGGLAGGEAFEAKALFEARDVLRGFVGDAGDRVSVIKEFPGAVGAIRAALAEKAAMTVLSGSDLAGVRGMGVVNNLQYLAFSDTADTVQIGAALAFHLAGVLGLLPQPIEDARGGQYREPGHGSEIMPVSEKVFHRLIS